MCWRLFNDGGFVVARVRGILIIVVIGAILFWVIDKFAPDARLAQLLKLLVVLVCLGAIVTRLLPLLGYSSFLAAPPATPQSVP
jgi:uncharacterized membrane protein YvlD (DUF360 family)